jgi:hypothetical protein
MSVAKRTSRRYRQHPGTTWGMGGNGCITLSDPPPEFGVHLVETAPDQPCQSFCRLWAAGLEYVLVVNRISPRLRRQTTYQQTCDHPALREFQSTRRDVRRISHPRRPAPRSKRRKRDAASTSFRSVLPETTKTASGLNLVVGCVNQHFILSSQTECSKDSDFAEIECHKSVSIRITLTYTNCLSSLRRRSATEQLKPICSWKFFIRLSLCKEKTRPL